MKCLVLALLLPLVSWADDVCPWINSATAGGVLGGTVTVKVTRSDKNQFDAVCEFSRNGGRRLLIEVATMAHTHSDFGDYLAKCGVNATPIRAIGNEAVACGVSEGELVVSRVRDEAFTVRVSDANRAAKAQALRDEALDIAEQVAGLLF